MSDETSTEIESCVCGRCAMHVIMVAGNVSHGFFCRCGRRICADTLEQALANWNTHMRVLKEQEEAISLPRNANG